MPESSKVPNSLNPGMCRDDVCIGLKYVPFSLGSHVHMRKVVMVALEWQEPCSAMDLFRMQVFEPPCP